MKGTSTCEKLIQARQLRVDEILRQCAVEKQDDKILAITIRDTVAAEAHYHNSCYRYYNWNTKHYQESRKASKDEDEGEIAYNMAENEAVTNLIAFIRNEMLPNKQNVPVATFASKMESFMHSLGFTVNDSTKKHIKRRLNSLVGDIIHIYKNDSGKLLVVPDSMTARYGP